MEPFAIGQRWISTSEPELGLGTIVQVQEDLVRIQFPAGEESRQYAADNAPLKRIRFRAGDSITDQDESEMVVRQVREKDGLVFYLDEKREIPETELSDRISFHGAEDRLFGGHFDDLGEFELRARTLDLQHHRRRLPVRGFIGARIDLIPHQLFIAHEVSSRHAPRVLLSDEVGLGKTIEACLILHRLLLNGRAHRVLVLVPDSLIHQWFVEMLRRFNVWLHIFDEERCAAIEAGQPAANPFLDDQLVLAGINFLAASEKRAQQAIDAGWDVLVVDEAHHLEWSEESPSPQYALVEALSREADGLLLLTATPEQLGMESHFARLRLLDPDRYGDLPTFLEQADHYRTVAEVLEKLVDGRKLSDKDLATLKSLSAVEPDLFQQILSIHKDGAKRERESLIENLLDLHGPGRVQFRNTRHTISGFPGRKAHLIPLIANEEAEEWGRRMTNEFLIDCGRSDVEIPLAIDLLKDPRVEWLASLLRELDPEKVLLICRSPEKVRAIDEALQTQLTVKSGVFHEGLTLLQRDRNAAWFAEADGARLLLCSEIGSEGRNFQFAHHLVLFDLPLNPELLEQRIGRLDRIGQTREIQVHIPFLKDSPQEVLGRWYHEGLDAIESHLQGGHELLGKFGDKLQKLALQFPKANPAQGRKKLNQLVRDSAKAAKDLRQRLEQGRDRLLEMNSFRPKTAAKIVAAIQDEDADPLLRTYMLDVFDQYGVHLEELAEDTYQLSSHGVSTEAFPSIPKEGMVATFNRSRAVAREDVGFLTWDHPMVTGAMDLLLGSEKGNSCFAVLPDPNDRTVLLDLQFILEAISGDRLHVDRFLPATPIRVVMNHRSADVTADYPRDRLQGRLRKGNPFKLIDHSDIAQKILPSMIESARSIARKQAEAIVRDSLQNMNDLLGHELQRLQRLRKVNDHIRPAEIDLADAQQQKLADAIQTARIRLDSLRLIWKGDPAELG